jgi:hypothetical protein
MRWLPGECLAGMALEAGWSIARLMTVAISRTRSLSSQDDSRLTDGFSVKAARVTSIVEGIGPKSSFG